MPSHSLPVQGVTIGTAVVVMLCRAVPCFAVLCWGAIVQVSDPLCYAGVRGASVPACFETAGRIEDHPWLAHGPVCVRSANGMPCHAMPCTGCHVVGPLVCHVMQCHVVSHGGPTDSCKHPLLTNLCRLRWHNLVCAANLGWSVCMCWATEAPVTE